MTTRLEKKTVCWTHHNKRFNRPDTVEVMGDNPTLVKIRSIYTEAIHLNEITADCRVNVGLMLLQSSWRLEISCKRILKWLEDCPSFAPIWYKSCTTGKAGGLKEPEPLKAVENQEPPEGDC